MSWMMHLGIDYGSKMAGTTAICYQEGEELVVVQSEKKKDADLFIKEKVSILKPKQIFIDAPLSLPGAYFGNGEDYFYRACDRQLKAMSPMFLGGLTARAMKLAKTFEDQGIQCYESYPAALVRDNNELQLKYQKKSTVNTPLIKSLSKLIGLKLKRIDNYHQIDSVLCWFIGKRHLSGDAKLAGIQSEGQIFY